jgi:hypothetical protein
MEGLPKIHEDIINVRLVSAGKVTGLEVFKEL